MPACGVEHHGGAVAGLTREPLLEEVERVLRLRARDPEVVGGAAVEAHREHDDDGRRDQPRTDEPPVVARRRAAPTGRVVPTLSPLRRLRDPAPVPVSVGRRRSSGLDAALPGRWGCARGVGRATMASVGPVEFVTAARPGPGLPRRAPGPPRRRRRGRPTAPGGAGPVPPGRRHRRRRRRRPPRRAIGVGACARSTSTSSNGPGTTTASSWRRSAAAPGRGGPSAAPG